MKVTTIYHGDLNTDLDDEIMVLWKSKGWTFIGSGYNLMKNVRDIQFWKENIND